MGIPDEDVARVREATDIVLLVGEHAALKKQGRRWVGLCPFHSEKTPSFSVNAEQGFYYCFGCQAKGDAISFVRAIEHLDFVDAVRQLADKAGITIREDANAGRDSQRRKIFLDVMEQAAEWYHQRLLVGADAPVGIRLCDERIRKVLPAGAARKGTTPDQRGVEGLSQASQART